MAKAPKPAEEQEAGGKAPEKATGKAKPSLLSRGLEATVSGSWKVIRGIASYTSQLVRGTLSGAWKATGGAIGRGIAAPFRHIAKSVGDVAEIGRQIAAEAQERHHIGKLSPALKGIMLATAMSIGNALYLPASPFVGAGTSALEGAENVGSALVMKYDAHKGTGEAHAATKANGNGAKHEEKHG